MYLEKIVADGREWQPDLVTEFEPGTDKLEFHYTALSYAAVLDDRSMCELLLNAGAELDHLRAGRGDEASVRCPPGGRELGRGACDRLDGAADGADQRAGLGEERPSRVVPVDLVVHAVPVEDGLDPLPELLGRHLRRVP